jgi:hypothetical protein
MTGVRRLFPPMMLFVFLSMLFFGGAGHLGDVHHHASVQVNDTLGETTGA